MRWWQLMISVCLFLVTTIQTIMPCCAAVNRSNTCSKACCEYSQLIADATKPQPCKCRNHSKNDSQTPPIKSPQPQPICPYCQSTVIISNSTDFKIQTESNSHSFAVGYSSICNQPQYACTEVAQLPEKYLPKSTTIVQLGQLLL